MIVPLAVLAGVWLSETITVKLTGPVAWLAAVAHVRMPVVGSMLAPDGAPFPRLKVSGNGGVLGSDA